MESCSMALSICFKICTLRRRPCDSIIAEYLLHTFARQQADHLLAPFDKSHLSSLDETASRFANSTSASPATRFNVPRALCFRYLGNCSMTLLGDPSFLLRESRS